MGAKFFLDDVPPEEFRNALLVMRSGQGLTKDEIIGRFDERSWSHHSRFSSNTLGRMTDIGVLTKDQMRYRLTTPGEVLKRLLSSESDTFYDYIHYLHLQEAAKPESREYLWTYWLLCQYLGERDGAWSGQEAATRIFAELQERFQVETLAIDKGSLAKMLRWVRLMTPNPVDESGKSVVWRASAPARPFLLGIDFFYKLHQIEYGYPILLTPENRTILRRIGFFTESGLDTTLALCSRMHSSVRMHTSAAGVSVILERAVSIEELE